MSEPLKKLIVDLPASIKDKLEVEKQTTGKTVKKIILEAIELYFSSKK